MSEYTKGILGQPLGTTQLIKTGKIEREDDAYGNRICVLSSVNPPTASNNPGETIHEVYLKIGTLYLDSFDSEGNLKPCRESGKDYEFHCNVKVPIDTTEKKIYGYKKNDTVYSLFITDKDDKSGV